MNSMAEIPIVTRLKQFRDRWFPKTLIEVSGSDFRYSRYVEGDWIQVESLPDTQSVFEQRTLLIPDSLTFFNLREFPVDSVSRQALAEAVELDLVRWSPLAEGIDFYFWPKRCGETWQVAVWVWQSSDLSTLLEKLEYTPAYIMPSQAWKLGSLEADETDLIHIVGNPDGSWTYTGVRKNFSVLRIANVKNQTDARRFDTALGGDIESLTRFVDRSRIDSAPEWESNLVDPTYGSPDFSALASARQPGISDWSDPFVWARPIGAALALYIVWLLGTGLVLVKQSEEVRAYSEQVGSLSTEVLDARAEVSRLNAVLETLGSMRENQTQLEALLASLSKTLPKNAWLEHADFRSDDGGWLEITGKSEQSAPLAAILEEMPEVEQAEFLTDIRMDQRTGLEPFKLRLKLTSGDRDG